MIVNLRLVVSIAKKYVNRCEHPGPIQEGSFGLITAVDKFDPEHSCRFSTYAHYWIKQAVTRAISDFSRPIRLPVHMSDCVNAIKRQRNVFWQTHGRAPTELELSSSLGISEAKLRLAMSSSRELVSLESPYFVNKPAGSDDKSWGDYIQDSAPKPEHQLEAALLREQLSLTLLNVLLPQEREIVCMRYGLDGVDKRSLEEMGRMYGSQGARVADRGARDASCAARTSTATCCPSRRSAASTSRSCARVMYHPPPPLLFLPGAPAHSPTSGHPTRERRARLPQRYGIGMRER